MGALSFLSPWFLLGLAAAAGPLLLHLFARENAPVAMLPTARFVPRAAVEQTRRRRLQDLWLLLLRLAAVVLLALVFARPFFERPAASAGQALTIVAVDRSFSMAGGTRLVEAKRLARAAVDEAPGGTRVALVAFDQEARVVVAPTVSRGDVLGAIDSLVAGFGGTNVAGAVRAAADLAAAQPARLVIVSDVQRAGVDAEALPVVPRSLEVAVRPVAVSGDNLSIDILERADQGALALVRNHGPAARRTQIRWSVDARQVSSAFLDVAAGGVAEVRLPRSLPERAAVQAAIDDDAGYAADNARFLVTDPPSPVPVLVVVGVDAARDASLYVTAALEAATARGQRFDVTAIAAADARLIDASVLGRTRALVLVGTRGLDRRARVALGEAVRRGCGVFVAAGPDVEPGVVRELVGEAAKRLGDGGGEAVEGQGVAVTDLRHPVVAALGDTAGNLGQVRVERAWPMDDWQGATPLLRLSNGRPALLELPVGQGRAFVLATDVGRRWNTWPTHPTFVPFIVEAVRHLTGERAQRRDVLVGDIGLPGEARPGVFEIGSERQRVAVNVDPRESTLDVVTPEELLGRLTRTESEDGRLGRQAGGGRHQELWRQMLWALLGVLAIEGVIAGRARGWRRAGAGAEHGLDAGTRGGRA